MFIHADDIIKNTSPNGSTLHVLYEPIEKAFPEKLTRKIICAKEDEPVVEAFKRMGKFKIPAVPVINEGKKVTSTLSSYLLRHISNNKILGQIEHGLTVKDFLDAMPSTAVAHHSTLFPAASVIDVMNAMIECTAHRVWIVDEENERPISCVSMSDVLEIILDLVCAVSEKST